MNNLDVLAQSHIAEEVNYGNTMMQTQTAYATALQIQKPRSPLQKIVSMCESEAALAGQDFYYSWKQGSEVIEGLSVNAAIAIARNYGNCAVDVKIQENKDSYIFTGYFIDLETGFNIARPFRQNRQSPKTKQGKDIYSGDRGNDIIFQIGASKAIRNVILNAMPSYITERVIEKAKAGVLQKYEEMGVVKATTLIIKKVESLKIDLSVVENTYGNSQSWTIEKIVMIAGSLKSIEDGVMRVNEVFKVEVKEEEQQTKIDISNLVKKSEKTEEKIEDLSLRNQLIEKLKIYDKSIEDFSEINGLDLSDENLLKSILSNEKLFKKYLGEAL